MSDTKTVRLPCAIAEQLNSMTMIERRALLARALAAPAESLVEAPVAGVETKMKVALPERGELVPGLPGAGSPVIASKTVWSTGRNGLGGSVEWPGAVVHLPPAERWFFEGDDACRVDAVQAARLTYHLRSEEREARLRAWEASLIPEPQRPVGAREGWFWLPVWIPPCTVDALHGVCGEAGFIIGGIEV